MAGDWIKMRSDLFTHPKVVRISSALKADTLRTVGGLMSVWCLFDAHSVDGRLEGYTPDYLDAHLRWEGFAEAMMAVGWLISDDQGLVLPRFDTHNGQSAKRRAQDADRKREVRKVSASDADKKRTREEKRREEGIETPPSVARRSSTGQKTLSTYLDECKAAGVKPVPDNHPIRAYCHNAGITNEMASIAWLRFREDHTVGTRKAKRYTDWPAAFANSIKDRWYRLWVVNADGEANWTNEGLQARRVVEAQAEVAA